MSRFEARLAPPKGVRWSSHNHESLGDDASAYAGAGEGRSDG